jgi:hypothetical protein
MKNMIDISDKIAELHHLRKFRYATGPGSREAKTGIRLVIDLLEAKLSAGSKTLSPNQYGEIVGHAKGFNKARREIAHLTYLLDQAGASGSDVSEALIKFGENK